MRFVGLALHDPVPDAIPVQIFVAVLAASSFTYAEALQ